MSCTAACAVPPHELAVHHSHDGGANAGSDSAAAGSVDPVYVCNKVNGIGDDMKARQESSSLRHEYLCTSRTVPLLVHHALMHLCIVHLFYSCSRYTVHDSQPLVGQRQVPQSLQHRDLEANSVCS